VNAKATSIPDYYWSGFSLPVPEKEYKFHKTRRWRIDFAWPDIKLAIEIEGGIFTKGRHTRATGFLGDIVKYNSLQESGWALLRYPPNAIDYNQICRVYRELSYKVKLLRSMI